MASIYTALDISNYEIRIITIHPGDDDTIISCTLHKQSLLAEQEYTALSYCWGDPAVTDHIIVNGERAAVTINLRDALLQLRSIGVERVWADALCINQKDIQERSLQVRNMTQVYARAVRTYSWLGKEGSDRATASLIFLRQIISAGIEIDSIEHMHMSLVDTGIDLDVASACPSCLAKASFQDLKDIFHRDYWRRRWVIQEIVAARRVQVVCGRESIDLGDLMGALELYKESKHWSPDLISCGQYLQQIIDIRLQYQSGRPQTLCESMVSTQRFLSSDSRDKVFALIGITSDGGRLVPTPSYYQDFESVLTDLAAAVFREHRNFNMMVLDRRNRAASPGLPTWVPDLPVEDPKDLSSTLHDELLNSRLLERSLSGPPGTLRVQGVIVGVIVTTSSVLMNVPLGISTVEVTSNDTISTATPQTQPQEYYGSSSETLRALIEMLFLPITTAHVSHSLFEQLIYFFMPWNVYDGLHLVRHTLRCTNTQSLASLQGWIDTNKTFFLGKKSLSEWLTEGKTSYYYHWLKTIPLRVSSLVTVVISSLLSIGFTVVAPIMTASSLVHYNIILVLFLMFFFIFSSTFVLMLLVYSGDSFDYSEFAQKYESHAKNRMRMIFCDKGFMGMSTADAQGGDRVCLIVGCSTAVVLRKTITQPGDSYAMIGLASITLAPEHYYRYEPLIQGLRYGLAQDDQHINNLQKLPEWREFTLV